MSAAKRKSSVKRPEMESKKPEKRPREDNDLFDTELSSEIKGIMSALHQIKEKAQKDDKKKHEEMISSVSSEIQSMLEDMKSKMEKDRLAFVKSLAKTFKECESTLKDESVKFQEIYEKFNKEKTTHLQAVKDAMSKFDEDKEKLMKRYEQMKKKDKNMLSEHERASAEKIAALEHSLKKKQTKEVNPFNFLRKVIMPDGEDDHFALDD